MVLWNSGASPLHNVRMVISHPDVFCPLSNEELQDTPLSALSGMHQTYTTRVLCIPIMLNITLTFCRSRFGLLFMADETIKHAVMYNLALMVDHCFRLSRLLVGSATL